jgi:hypothetical protein
MRYYGIYDGLFDTSEKPAPNLDNPGLIHRLLNSKSRFLALQEFVQTDNAAGFSLRELRSPIYFKREERELTVVMPSPEGTDRLIFRS